MAYVMDGAVNDVLQYVTVVFSQARPYIYKLVQFIEVLLASVPVAHHAGLNSLKTCLRACLVAPTDLPSLLDWIRKLAKLYRRFTVPLNDQLVDPVQGDVAQFGGNAQPVQAAGAWNVGTLNAMGAAAQLNTFIASMSRPLKLTVGGNTCTVSDARAAKVFLQSSLVTVARDVLGAGHLFENNGNLRGQFCLYVPPESFDTNVTVNFTFDGYQGNSIGALSYLLPFLPT